MEQNRLVLLAGVVVLVLAACGGGDSQDNSDAGSNGDSDGSATTVTDEGGGSGTRGDVVNPQPPGQAYASVDGLEFVLDNPAPGDCVIEPDRLTFGFLLTEDGAELAGGANRSDGKWVGDIALGVYEDGSFVGRYYPDEGAMDTGVAIDGESMSFSGPMLKQPPNDGSNPPPLSVGDGSFSVTCP